MKRSILIVGLVLLLAAAPFFADEDQRAEIINLRYHTHPNFTRIVLDIGKLREYNFGELAGPGRIYVDVLQAKLNPILEGQGYPIRTDYLSQIRIAQKVPSTVRVTADVDFTNVESFRVYHIFDRSVWSSTSTPGKRRPRKPGRLPRTPPSSRPIPWHRATP